MRKILFLIPLLFICTISTHSYAITQDECGVATTQGECPAGCYWNDTYGCRVCEAGTYNEASGQDSCKKCSVPKGGELTDERTGLTTNSCTWTVSCAAGHYWESTGDDFGCAMCSAGYSGSNAIEEISGSGLNPDVGGDTDAVLNWIKSHGEEEWCTPKIITLDLQKNTAMLVWGSAKYEDKIAYAKYNNGFAMSQDSDEWSANLPTDALQPNRPVKQFMGYFDQDKCGGDMYFNAGGVFQQDWSKLTSDKTLHACWNNVDVTVNYYDADGTVYKTQSCTVDDNSETVNCIAQDYTGDESAGNVFSSYSCTYGDGTPCNPQTLNPGDSIPLGNATINLRPVFQECSVGHYCEGNEEKPCPAGTTSKSGSKTVKDCYMVAGENGTQFCDVNGCFTLPGTGNIAYE